MYLFNPTRKPVNFYALLSIIALTITAVYLINISYQRSPKHVTEVVQKITDKRWNNLKTVADEFAQKWQKLENENINEVCIEKISKKDISIFIKHNDKIVFWSDNKVPFESAYLQLENYTNQRIIRLDNGWYQIVTLKFNNHILTALSLIKKQYPYENEHLVSEFQYDYQIKVVPEIKKYRDDYNVYDNINDEFLFSLSFDEKTIAAQYSGRLSFPLFLITFVFINLLLLHLHRKLNPFSNYPNAAIVAFSIDAVIVRLLIFYFSFPSIIHDAYLFNPQLYASSFFNCSLGDLFLNGTTVLLIAIAIFIYWKPAKSIKNSSADYLVRIGLLASAAAILYFYAIAIKSLVLDSTLSFDFQNLLSVDQYSFVGLLFMVMISVALLLFIYKIYSGVTAGLKSIRRYLYSSIPAFLVLSALSIFLKDTVPVIVLGAYTALTLLFVLAYKNRIRGINLVISLLIIVSLMLTALVNEYEVMKEKEHRIIAASYEAQKDDPMTEFLFTKAQKKIYQDTVLAEMLFHDTVDEPLIITYILHNYFDKGEKHWLKYNFQITICDPLQKLVIEPYNEIINCYEFFDRQVYNSGTITLNPDLVLMHDHLEQTHYLGVFRFECLDGSVFPEGISVFVEMFPKIVPVDAGYLELLIDESLKREAALNKYVNARYKNDELIASYGKYIYSLDLSSYREKHEKHNGYFFFSKDGYSHLYFPADNDNVIIVSVPEKSFLDKIAPFSIFLLVFLLIFTITYQIGRVINPDKKSKLNFKNRLQLTFLSIIIVSFILIGYTSVHYIRILNSEKNIDNLKDKARSIRIELEHRLADKEILDHDLEPYINSLLLKFNDVYATDINLFDINGDLLGSSRQTIFNEGITSRKMNIDAYRQMAIQSKTFLIHQENIGKLNYLSAYIPFRNDQNRVIAYINLPYFARQSELSNEISSFLMTFINIYLLLIAITIIFAFLISDMIAKPLIMIRNKIQKVKLGAANEKIFWHRQDEIGDLVNEYNRMIDELDKSAALLAKSERESAWREMAKQIAHEIKNPLTPMKLNLQYLERTLDQGKSDWEERFKKYAEIMNRQIESLSTIATAFSDFANIPKEKTQNVNVNKVINNAITLFEGYDDVIIKIELDDENSSTIKGDPEQVSRMIINLLTNAVQAKIPDKTLTINVKTKNSNGALMIIIEDDGAGIDEELHDKIFLPQFTTKTSGMGLGLAITQSIVQSMSGTISFTSKPDSGTSFKIIIPKNS